MKKPPEGVSLVGAVAQIVAAFIERGTIAP
jgi:hypothetical protein